MKKNTHKTMYSIRTYEAIHVYKNNSKMIEIQNVLQDTKTEEKGISEIPSGKTPALKI